MEFRFFCPSCGQKLKAEEKHAWRTVGCPHRSVGFRILQPAHTPYRRQKDYGPDTIAGPIDRVLIIETKGKKFYDADFKAKEKFIQDVFLKHNPNSRYLPLVDEDDNDFSRHLETVKQEITRL